MFVLTSYDKSGASNTRPVLTQNWVRYFRSKKVAQSIAEADYGKEPIQWRPDKNAPEKLLSGDLMYVEYIITPLVFEDEAMSEEAIAALPEPAELKPRVGVYLLNGEWWAADEEFSGGNPQALGVSTETEAMDEARRLWPSATVTRVQSWDVSDL